VTYHLHLSIGDDLRDDVQAYAEQYGISLAAAVRILLRKALNGSDS
jgi:antitoxin component of RelBE/YafQ-DinJ toxin-antitoxin module